MLRKLLGLSLSIVMINGLYAQNSAAAEYATPGIRFEQGLSWEQVKAKAKSENKYIFVDCYTTWCGPCKKMEKEVYPQEKVGEYFNDKFISVKVQMDTSKVDEDAVKKWYGDARQVREQYKVSAYPTYLFFTPDGQLLDRGLGAHETEAFIAMADKAIDPKNNYYAQYEQFQKGQRDPAEMSMLARRALELGDTASSQVVAKTYLAGLKEENLLTKENIEFMRKFTNTSSDRGFSLFYKNTDSINRLMKAPDYAQGLVQSVLYKEIIKPAVKKANETNTVPDWGKISAMITKKYNAEYADRVVVAARLTWGLEHKDYAEYTKYYVQYVEKYGAPTETNQFKDLVWNNYAWQIFLYSNNKEELEKALSWSNKAVMISPMPNWMDTYANLLYKLGRKENALRWQGIAIKLSPDDAELRKTMEAMKNDQPTWPLHN